MNSTAEKISELQGYKLHVIETEKYKTNTFVWRMKAPLTKEDVTKGHCSRMFCRAAQQNIPQLPPYAPI